MLGAWVHAAQLCPAHSLHRLVPRAVSREWLGLTLRTQRDTEGHRHAVAEDATWAQLITAYGRSSR